MVYLGAIQVYLGAIQGAPGEVNILTLDTVEAFLAQ